MTQRNLYYKNNLVSQSSPLYVLHIWQFYMVQGGSYVDGTLKRELSIFMLEMTSLLLDNKTFQKTTRKAKFSYHLEERQTELKNIAKSVHIKIRNPFKLDFVASILLISSVTHA